MLFSLLKNKIKYGDSDFFKNKFFTKYKSESRRSSGDTCEKCESTPILSPKDFSNDQALIIMIFSVLLSNPPLYILFLVLQSTMLGFSTNLMLIMLFFKATCLKMFSWLNHWDSLTVIILIMCANFTKLFVVSSKHYMLSIMSSISFFSPLASLTLILKLDYLSSTLVVSWFISLFKLIMLS